MLVNGPSNSWGGAVTLKQTVERRSCLCKRKDEIKVAASYDESNLVTKQTLERMAREVQRSYVTDGVDIKKRILLFSCSDRDMEQRVTFYGVHRRRNRKPRRS